MNENQTAFGTKPPAESSKAVAAGAWWGEPRLVGYVLYLLALSLAFSGLLMELVKYAWKEELHSHILLMPLVVAYLASQKRATLLREPRGPVYAAVIGTTVFALPAMALLLWSRTSSSEIWSHNDMMSRMAASYVLFIVAGGFVFLGSAWMRLLVFPFSLMMFMVPMPDIVVAGMENLLMRASAWLAHWLFLWTGTPVFQVGQVMELPGMTLEVASECSGIRSSLVLFITSLIASYWFLSSSSHRIMLVALVIPLGILRNAMRVVVIGLLCVHRGPEMIDSWIHRHGGPVFFAASLVPLLLVAMWLRHREGRFARRPNGTCNE